MWLLAALVLLGAEAMTLQFVLVYFGLGALIAGAAFRQGGDITAGGAPPAAL